MEKVIGVLMGVLFIIVVFGVAFTVSWNLAVPPVTGLPYLDVIQGSAIVVMVRIVSTVAITGIKGTPHDT